MIAWPEIDTVLLDMDGTLLDLHFDNHFWCNHLPLHYATLQGMEQQQAFDLLHGRYEVLKGTLPWYCLDHWTEELGIDIRQLKEEVAYLIQERPHAIRFLQWLKEQGKKRVLITNAHRGSLDLKLRLTRIGDELDTIISSHDYGAPKESPKFWQSLTEQINYDSSRALFIDDSLSVLRAGKQAGVKHLLHILHPDSKQPPNKAAEFPAIHHFGEIVPIASAAIDG